MTDVTTPHTLSQFRAWVGPAGNVNGSRVYPFLLDDFQHQPRLIPMRVRDAASGMGTASFRLLRQQREENGSVINDPGNVDIGCYIAVTKNTITETFDPDAVIFWGYISSKDITQLEGTTDTIGTVTASGLGFLLDTIQLKGFRQAVAGGGASTEIITPPTFNLEGDGGVIIGNKVTDSASIPVLAGLPSLCSPTALFSRYDVLAHLFKYCLPEGMPEMEYSADDSDVTVYLQTTADREVFDIGNLTLKGALDLLIPRSQGFGWRIYPTNATPSKWQVTIYALLRSLPNAYGTGFPYPGATPTNIDAADIEADSVGYNEDASDIYDEVVVEGDNILIGATVSFADGNMAKGWTTTQEERYRIGASEADDYDGPPALPEDEKRNRNEEIRNSAELRDVFQLFTLDLTTNNILRSGSPGDGSPSVPLIPEILWSGTAATVSAESTNRVPYLPLTRFSRVVPWEVGKRGDGTDNRDAASKARPEYLKPRVFRYDIDAPDYDVPESVCADLLIPSTLSNIGRPAPTVTPDDRVPGLRISYSPPEWLAKAQWDDDVDGISRLDPIQNGLRTIDYEKLAITVGIPSDQKVSVTITREGVGTGTKRSRLIVRDPRLQCWVMLAGSIVGTNKDGEADRVAVDTFTRNDFPTAQRMATALAGFAFRKRSAISVTLAEPDNIPAWVAIGQMIGQITEQAASETYPAVVAEANTVVESIDYDLRYDSPRVTVTTTLANPPTSAFGGGSASPTGGGSVSGSLGGTVAQATARNIAKGRDTAERTASIPTSFGIDLNPLRALHVLIDKGNTLETGQDGVAYESGGVASVPSAYDPDVTDTFIDGIGRGTLFVNNISQDGYVLVVNDNRGSFGNSLRSGDRVAVSDPVSIPVDGGGSVRAYVIA